MSANSVQSGRPPQSGVVTRPEVPTVAGDAESNVASPVGSVTYTITELAREFGITPRAIRFYEDQGLLAPARAGAGGRQRVYNGRERTRLRLALRGKRLGFSLNEIREILDLYESPRDTAPQLERFLASLAEHRNVLEGQLTDLHAQLAEIDQHIAQCSGLLAGHRHEETK